MTLSKEFMNSMPVEAFASSRIAAREVLKIFPDIKVNVPKTTLTPTLKKKESSPKVHTTGRG